MIKDIAKKIRENQNESGMLRRSLERIIQLYTDKAHFVYELLQNAEDAQATKIKFKQYDDRLEVMHDGKPFTETNLQGLCDIGKSDKTKELNQIGEFGVGFKSVFGICETVRLYSRPQEKQITDDCYQFAVEIKDFTRPEKINKSDYDKSYLNLEEDYTTLFIFPYAVGHAFSGFKSIPVLKQAISSRLKNLGFTTLLFMRHLQRIEYAIETNEEVRFDYYGLNKKTINEKCELITSIGKIESESSDLSELTTKTNKKIKTEIIKNGYLKFSRPIKINELTNNSVDIAYAVDIDENGKLTFKKPNHPYISVYFPTETESKLNFIIQGPFRTTPNRSSVPADDEDNIKLAEKVSDLIHESVIELRKLNLLNLSFLGILPLKEEPFNSYPLFKNLYYLFPELFSRTDLLPTYSGGYTTSKSALLVRGKSILELFDDNTISDLIGDGEEHFWLPPQISETGTGVLKDVWNYCANALKIEIYRLEDLKVFFQKNKHFLPKMSNEWLIKFYKAFEAIPYVFFTNKNVNILETPIIKTSKKTFVAAYRKVDDKYIPNVFLPTFEEEDSVLSIVDYDIYKNCESFFISLRIHAPERYAYFVEQIKTRYSVNQDIPDEQYIKDIKEIINFLKEESIAHDLRELLKDLRILRCRINGRNTYFAPFGKRIYFPKSESGLNIEEYYKNIADDKIFIDYDFYSENGLKYDNLRYFDICDSILIGENDISGYVSEGSGRPTKWCTEGLFRRNLSIDKLQEAISYIAHHADDNNSIIKSSIIFKIVQQNIGRLTGILTKGTASRSETFNEKARIINILSSSASVWLYDTDCNVLPACKLTKLDLNTDIYGTVDAYSRIYDLLEFKKTQEDDEEDIVKEYDSLSSKKKNIFFETELLRRFNLTASDLEKVIVSGSKNNSQGEEYTDDFEFPVVEVKNWDALRKHAAQILTYSAPVEYKEVIRSVRTSHSSTDVAAYLKNMYRIYGTNKYACQLCHNAVDSIESCQLENNPNLELEPLHICLCSNCAHKFRKIRNVEALESKLINEICAKTDRAITDGKQITIEIDKYDIWFAQTHVAEIRELMALKKNLKKEIPEFSYSDVDVKKSLSNDEFNNESECEEKEEVRIDKENKTGMRINVVNKAKSDETTNRPIQQKTTSNHQTKSKKDPSYYIDKKIYHVSKDMFGIVVNCYDNRMTVKFDDGKLMTLDWEFSLNNGLIRIVDNNFDINKVKQEKLQEQIKYDNHRNFKKKDPNSLEGKWVSFRGEYWYVTKHDVRKDRIWLQLDPKDANSERLNNLNLKFCLAYKIIKLE